MRFNVDPRNKNILVISKSDKYSLELYNILKSMENKNIPIIYACFNKPYEYILEELKERKLNLKNFFFIDILSSHYSTPKTVDNCIFIEDPNDFDGIESAIKTFVVEKKCRVIIFDTLSELLMFESAFLITKFVNNIKTGILRKNNQCIIIILDEEEYLEDEVNMLVKDIKMLTDKTISFA